VSIRPTSCVNRAVAVVAVAAAVALCTAGISAAGSEDDYFLADLESTD
jgi:hypothetical protein